jgi:hypothetical protein
MIPGWGDLSVGEEDLKTIRSEIRGKCLSWQAGVTSVSSVTGNVRKRYLGLSPEKDEVETVSRLAAEAENMIISKGISYVYPASWDWRNVSSKDWTTPIRDQSGCGACVAFACVGMIETNIKISKKSPLMSLDLSEWDLFHNGGGNCAYGWIFTPAMKYAQSKGICSEECYPYLSDDSPCSSRDSSAVKITQWKLITNNSLAKEWLYKTGPIVTGFEVCDDFFYYTGGVYSNTYGSPAGDHAVCVVGYNDAEQYWICKNSWGKGWGENGWFKIAYGQCGFGTKYGFYGVSLTPNHDIVMPNDGRAFAKFVSKGTASNHEVRLHYPSDALIFQATAGNIGKSFEIGTFRAGTNLTFELKTSDGNTYFTDSSLNADGCDHVSVSQIGTYTWKLGWEDLYGLGEADYNDVVMQVDIYDKSGDDLVLPLAGKVMVTFKSKNTAKTNELRTYYPKDNPIFTATSDNLGKTFDLGAYQAGAKIGFAIRTSDGNTFYSDRALNADLNVHVRRVATGYNKWEYRWEDTLSLKDTDYDDLIVMVEVLAITDDDIVLPKAGKVKARFVSKSTSQNNEFRLYSPVNKAIFPASDLNLGKTFDVGTFNAGTRIVFAIKTPQGTFYTNSSLNADGKDHVIKMALGTTRWQLRWEDLPTLVDTDYNDLVVEVSMV